MTLEIIRHIFRFFLLISVQVLLLNNFRFSGYINPYLYILFVLALPFETPIPVVLISSFFLGLFVDIFEDSAGLHAAATVLIGYCRSFVLKFFSPRDGYDLQAEPSLSYLGFAWFFSYSLILVAIHHFFFFFAEAFSFYEIGQTIIRSLGSVIFTMILVFAHQLFFYRQKERV